MTRPSSDGHRPAFISQADLSRRAGVARSTVSRACRQGGPLHVAVEADRVDVAHPAARKWLQGRGGSGVAELPTDVRFVPFELFAKLAEVEVPAVPVGFCDDNDRIDLSAPAVLEWLAARPFGRSGYRKGEVQAGELFVPGEWYSIRRRELDGSYRLRGVLMRAYLARLVGAVPTSADVKAFERAQRDFSFEFDDRIRTA